jgi:hypothetical protein
MTPPFEDIVIVDLDVQKTTWSRVHSAMRTLYLRLNRDPDIAWNKFFFEERNSRVEVKRHGLWIEEGYIVFDCLLIDVDSHHLPDIRQSITYANERSRELRESQREEREQLKAKARDEAEVLKALRANIRDERDRVMPEQNTDAPAQFETESTPEPDTAQSLEEAAHAQLAKEAEPVVPTPAETPMPDYERRLREFYEVMAPKTSPSESFAVESAEPEAAAPEILTVPETDVSPQTSASAAEVPAPAPTEATAPPLPSEPEVPPEEASEFDLQSKRNDWRARFRAAFERNKN